MLKKCFICGKWEDDENTHICHGKEERKNEPIKDMSDFHWQKSKREGE